MSSEGTRTSEVRSDSEVPSESGVRRSHHVVGREKLASVAVRTSERSKNENPTHLLRELWNAELLEGSGARSDERSEPAGEEVETRKGNLSTRVSGCDNRERHARTMFVPILRKSLRNLV